MKDEALEQARAAIKAGGSAKYQGKIHTSLASLPKSADDEEETSPDVAALLAEKNEIIEDLRQQVTRAIDETGLYSDRNEDLKAELDRTKGLLKVSDEVLETQVAENKSLEADNAKLKDEVTRLHADNEKLTKDLAEAKKPKAEPATATPTPTATPTTPASPKNT